MSYGSPDPEVQKARVRHIRNTLADLLDTMAPGEVIMINKLYNGSTIYWIQGTEKTVVSYFQGLHGEDLIEVDHADS